LSNYIVINNNGTLTVAPAPLLVRANDASRARTQPDPVFTANYTGFVNGEDSTVLSGTLTLVTTAGLRVGTYPIIPSGVTSRNYSITFINGTLTVTWYELVVNSDSISRTYGSTNPTFTGSVIGLQPGDNITASYSCPATASSPAGTYPITISLADPDGVLGNYSVTTNSGILTVEPATLTGAVDNQSRPYGQPNPVFTVTYSGFVNGDGAGILTGTLVGSSPAVANSPVGTYPITVSGQSAPNYTIRYVAGNLSVTPAPLLVQANDAVRAYGQPNPVFTGSLIGLQPGDNITPSYVNGALASSAVGVYPITISLADPDQKLGNYSLTTNNGILTVKPATLTGTADNQSRPYGQPNPVFTVAYSGFVNGDGAGILTGALVGSSPADMNSPVGTYPITASGQSAPNYTMQYVAGSLRVTPAPLVVQANDAVRAYGQANPDFTASYFGFVNGQDSNLLSGTLVLSTTAVTNSPVGMYPIIANGVTCPNYSIIFSNGTLTVKGYALVVSADSASRPYGSANPVFTGSLVGLQPGDNITANYSSKALASSAVGTYPITISLADPNQKLGNYSVTTNNGILTVEPATLTIIADNQSRPYGQPNPVFTAAYSGFVNGEDARIVTGILVGGSPADANSPVGTYPITVSGQSAPNYSMQYVTGALTVTPVPLLVQANDALRTYGAVNPDFSGSLVGLQPGDNVTASYLTEAIGKSPVGVYPITIAFADPDNKLGNYTVTTNNGTLTVEPAILTSTANNQRRFYGQPNPVFTITYTGLVNGEDASIVTGTLVGRSPADANSPVGTYPITVSGQSAPNYTLLYMPGILSVIPVGGSATTITLAWDASTGLAPAGFIVAPAGYSMYYGTKSHTYAGSVQLGTDCSCLVTGLVPGTKYYFAATAMDVFGNESDYSDEINYRLPNTGVTTTEVVSPSGDDVLAITGPPGKTYQLLASPDQEDGLVLGTGTIGSDGTLNLLLDPEAFETYPNWYLEEIGIPSALVLQLSLAPGPAVLLTAMGEVGHTYAVLAAQSPHTSDWTTLATIAPDRAGNMTFTDDSVSRAPLTFYRLKDVTLSPLPAAP
jgi:hypothetical protein